MMKRICLAILGAALLLSAALVASAARLPAAAQSSTTHSSTKKKRKRSVSSRSRRRTKGQTAPTADRIKEIQSALQREGAYNGEPTGKWDDATTTAVRSYQEKNGLSPTGKIDALTLEKLGLGSQTAGKAAPVPTASSVSPAAAASAPLAADPPNK